MWCLLKRVFSEGLCGLNKAERSAWLGKLPKGVRRALETYHQGCIEITQRTIKLIDATLQERNAQSACKFILYSTDGVH